MDSVRRGSTGISAARVSTLAAILALSAACSATGTSSSPQPTAAQLANSRWTTLLIDDDAVGGRGRPTLEFVGEGKIGGHAGCNSYFGKAHVSGHSMRFIDVGSTLVGCEQDVNEQERRFLGALTAIRSFRTESGRLVLLDAANKQRLLLEQDLSEPSPRSPSRRAATIVAPTEAAPYGSSAGSVVSSMQLPDPRNRRIAGLELVTMTDGLGQYFGTNRGALVVRAPGDNLFRLREGDVIVSVNGRQPATGEHALRILGSYQPREAVHLDLIRQRQPISLDITLPP
jgi:heat shock protein HslJ